MSSDLSQAAQLLATARRSRTPIKEFPLHAAPANIAEAYEIQDMVGRESGFYGWKVGWPKNGERDPRCALLPGTAAHVSPSILSLVEMDFDKVELEVAVVLGKDLPPIGRDYTAGDIDASIASLHLAFELVGSRFEDVHAVSPLSAIADHQGNVGVVIGAALEEWRDVDLETLELRLTIDGQEAGNVAKGASFTQILAQLTWLANHAVGRHGGLKSGDTLITGARIGPVPVSGARIVEGVGAPFPPVRFTLETALPLQTALKDSLA